MTIDTIPCASKFNLAITGTNYSVAVRSFIADEAVSECYSVELRLVAEAEILPKEVLQKEASLTVAGSPVDRIYHGLINEFTLEGQQGRFYLYRCYIVPYVWFLSLNSTYRIFQDKTVIEIADDVLKMRIPRHCYEMRVIHKYEKRRYCTQFGESDWSFLSRLFEDEGIFYFFEHRMEQHLLVIADDRIAYLPIEGDSCVQFYTADGMVAGDEIVASFTYSHGIRPGRISHTNYNFKRPSLDLTVQQRGETGDHLEIYEYPGDYVDPSRGKRLARVRLEEKKTLEDYAQGASNCPRFGPSYTFTLANHSFANVNKCYVLVKVRHKGMQNHVLGESTGIGGDASYWNSFLAIPAERTLRPERTLTKPHAGLQTATVTGPPGEEIHADEYGRVKVQFHWDREGERNEKSSCWLRISQPWSGQTWGMISLPRVGDEVLVDFINGDPDWPIIVGSVNNARSPALYALPANKTRSGIRTRSYPDGGRDNFHELRFEDKKGSEEIYLQSERDWNILVKNDKAQTVGNDETLLVKNDRKKTVHMNEREFIGANKTIDVGADQLERIGANKRETVGVNSAESVGAAKEVTIGGVYQISIGGIMNESVAGAKTEEVGMAKAVFVGANMAENVAGDRATDVGGDLVESVSGARRSKSNECVIEASKITLKCGNSTIVMDGSSITIKASKVFTN